MYVEALPHRVALEASFRLVKFVRPSRAHATLFQIKLDEEFLETVLPSMGTGIRVVKGKHRGRTGSLYSIEQDDFSCTVRFDVRSPAITPIPILPRCR